MALSGALFFLYRYGYGVLDPTRTDWLLGRSDPAMNLLAWLFFRKEPWSFPPGRILSYNWPEGTSIALTDALPLFALPLKGLSGILPPDFHYWGWWLLICHVVQAVFAHALISTLSTDRRVQISGALLALLMPAWLHRIGHMAISAHWILLAAWWLYRCEGESGGLRVRLRRWGLLLSVTAWVHPYLWVMAYGTGLVGWLRSWRLGRIGARSVAVLIVSTVAVSLLLWYLAGASILLGTDAYREEGLGNYSMNLNALWNSHGTSRWLPPLQLRTPGQYEGFNYLGLPMLLLAAMVFTSMFVIRESRQRLLDHREALAFCILATLYSLGPDWTYGDPMVLEALWPGWLREIGDVFRATGRFFWTCQYALLALVVSQTVKLLGVQRAGWVLAVAALLAAVEMQPMERVDRFLADRHFVPRFDLHAMEPLVLEGGRVVPVPPDTRSLVYQDDWREWALVALHRKASLGGGYVARTDSDARARFAEKVYVELSTGLLDARALYVLNSSAMSMVENESMETTASGGYYLIRQK